MIYLWYETLIPKNCLHWGSSRRAGCKGLEVGTWTWEQGLDDWNSQCFASINCQLNQDLNYSILESANQSNPLRSSWLTFAGARVSHEGVAIEKCQSWDLNMNNMAARRGSAESKDSMQVGNKMSMQKAPHCELPVDLEGGDLTWIEAPKATDQENWNDNVCKN